MSNPYDDAKELALIFGRFEYALKRSGFLADKKVAEARFDKIAGQSDWEKGIGRCFSLGRLPKYFVGR